MRTTYKACHLLQSMFYSLPGTLLHMLQLAKTQNLMGNRHTQVPQGKRATV